MGQGHGGGLGRAREKRGPLSQRNQKKGTRLFTMEKKTGIKDHSKKEKI